MWLLLNTDFAIVLYMYQISFWVHVVTFHTYFLSFFFTSLIVNIVKIV